MLRMRFGISTLTPIIQITSNNLNCPDLPWKDTENTDDDDSASGILSDDAEIDVSLLAKLLRGLNVEHPGMPWIEDPGVPWADC